MDGTNKEKIRQIENFITKKTALTETTDYIRELNTYYNFDRKTVGIDAVGIGAGVYDECMKDDDLKRVVIAINSIQKSKERDTDRKETVEKIDLYNNLLRMMERDEIRLLNDNNILLSLKSMQVEYTKTYGKVTIHGKYSHITEGIVRALWCIRTKGLSPVRY